MPTLDTPGLKEAADDELAIGWRRANRPASAREPRNRAGTGGSVRPAIFPWKRIAPPGTPAARSMRYCPSDGSGDQGTVTFRRAKNFEPAARLRGIFTSTLSTPGSMFGVTVTITPSAPFTAVVQPVRLLPYSTAGS